jgi:hypothetical protein
MMVIQKEREGIILKLSTMIQENIRLVEEFKQLEKRKATCASNKLELNRRLKAIDLKINQMYENENVKYFL